jgi:hypothetical protein
VKEFGASPTNSARQSLILGWFNLQKACETVCKAHRIAHDDPAWPGTAVDGTEVRARETADWLQDRLGIPPQSTAPKAVRAPRPPKEKLFVVWDHDKQDDVEMTETRLLEARTQPLAHMGCIEVGQDLPLRILTNRVSFLFSSFLPRLVVPCVLRSLYRIGIKSA